MWTISDLGKKHLWEDILPDINVCDNQKNPTKLPCTKNITPLVQKNNVLKGYNMPGNFERES